MNNTIEIKLSANTAKFLTALIVSSALIDHTPSQRMCQFKNMLKHQGTIYKNGKSGPAPSEVEQYVNYAKEAGIIEGPLENSDGVSHDLDMK